MVRKAWLWQPRPSLGYIAIVQMAHRWSGPDGEIAWIFKELQTSSKLLRVLKTQLLL